MRLPTMDFTLPWQLVAAHDPGPIYLTGSLSCARSKKGVNRDRQTRQSRMNFFALCIQSAERICFAYIVCSAEKSTDCVVFLATRHEKQTGCYLHGALRSVVCSGFSTPTCAAHFSRIMRGRVRETKRRDLRRSAGHPASLRFPAPSGTRRTFSPYANSTLPNSQRRKLLPAFSPYASCQSGNSRLRGHELPPQRRL